MLIKLQAYLSLIIPDLHLSKTVPPSLLVGFTAIAEIFPQVTGITKNFAARPRATSRAWPAAIANTSRPAFKVLRSA